MAKLTYIVEWDGQQRVALHVVSVADYREHGFYRQGVSMNAFRGNAHRVGAAKIQARQPGRRFHVRWDEEFQMDMESEERTAAVLAEHGKEFKHATSKLPRFEYANPKEFYASIGYNPKTKYGL